MRCDLHVHSVHSGMSTPPFFRHICRESYSEPAAVYARLKEKGMDLVTLTDHDSIGGAESLRGHPEFFVSEEVTCRMPSGTMAHIGVYDITERQHIEIQRRRDDLASLLAYLTERRLLFSVNHVFSGLTGRRTIEDFCWFEGYFPAFETGSGQMLPFQNWRAAELASRLGKAAIGGSDSHALPSVGSAYTEVAGARNRAEFLDGVRAGRATVGGGHGGYWKLTRDILWIACEMMREKPWTALLAPLAPLIPVATLANMAEEMLFARRWSARARGLSRDFAFGAGAAAQQAMEVL
jgi:predicted metal-dependent phosphoesterase TrpH